MGYLQRYAISDRRSYGVTEPERRRGLIRQAERWGRSGVEWVQVREKDLDQSALFSLVAEVVEVVARTGAATRVLVNGSALMARETGAAGVHLPGGSPFAVGDRVLQAREALGPRAYVSLACHTVDEAKSAHLAKPSLIIFAPVFEKVIEGGSQALAGGGLAMLSDVCAAAAPVPVFALGGVTRDNAATCIAAGAAGVAGIRLFTGDAWRALGPAAE